MDNHVDPNRAVAFAYIFKFAVVGVGAASIFFGYHLYMQGVGGDADLSIHSKSISGTLKHAAPGAFFAIAGLTMIVFGICKSVRVKSKRTANADTVEFCNTKEPDDDSSPKT